MAPGTVHCAVRANKAKSGRVMIELRNVLPCLRVVACFTTGGLAATAHSLHARRELATVRVGMAGCTSEPVKMIRRGTSGLRRLVAIHAGDCDVPASQYERALLVACQRERRWFETGFRVALLTAIQIRCTSELCSVRVLVAVKTGRKSDFKKRAASCREVTLGALYGSVLGAERKPSHFVLGERKLGRFEVFDRVAGLAFSTVSTFRELPVVRIGLMAVGTELKCDLCFEVSTAMTRIAVHAQVFTK